MAQFYKIIEANKLGEPWESHGNQIQTWWCKVEGEELDVSVGKKVGNEVSVGQHIYGELAKTVSKKGNEFWKFRGMQAPPGVSPPVSGVGNTEMLELLRDNNRRLRVLMGEDMEDRNDDSAKDEVVLDDDIDTDKPISLGDIPF